MTIYGDFMKFADFRPNYKNIRAPGNVTFFTGRRTDRKASAPATQELVITKLQDSVSTALVREALDGSGKLIVSPSCRRASILTSVWRVNGKNLDANG